MLIKVITIGKKSSKEYQSIIDEYQKRLDSSQKIQWEYIAPSSFSEQKARSVESNAILSKLKPSDAVWLLDERGEQVDSPALTVKIEGLKNSSTECLTIIIGGAYGVDEELRNRATWRWSLSKMVFPHQMVRLILIEQLYRAHEINRGSGYHHA